MSNVSLNIEKRSNIKVNNILTSRTIVGTFDIGDGIKHAFQTTLDKTELTGTENEQKVIVKNKIKDIVKSFINQSKPVQEADDTWNENFQIEI